MDSVEFVTKAIYDLLNSGVPIAVGDVELGAVEIKDHDSTTRADVGANGLHVDVQALAELPAGENHLGQVGGEGDTIAQTPTIDTDAYTANDNVGGLLEFANAARVSGGGGLLNKVVIIDDAKQDAELELWLFDRTFTQGADDAAWSPSEADLENLVDVVSTADGTYYDTASQGVCVIELARRYDLNGTSLFGRLVTRGTPTYAATDDLTVKVGLIQD